MSFQYNIWGISDTGYHQSISKSDTLESTTLDALKESFSDKNRIIAMDFSSANPMQDYFYSIEKRSNKILYTIYRTNWYRGARLSYDAATIISSSGSIENPITYLKALMNAYIAKKEEGIREINLDHILSNIKINHSEVPSRSVVKSGYIKYNTESDLLKVFENNRDTVKNFNKVYFFTKLPYFESGAGKIPNVSDYNPIAVSVINFDSSYHRVLVNGVDTKSLRTSQRQTFNCFPGDEIKVFNGNAQIASSVHQAVSAGKITLTPKPRSIVSNQKNSGSINRNASNRRRKKNQQKKIVLGISLLLVLFIGVFIAFTSFPPDPPNGGVVGGVGGGDNTETCDLVVKANSFTVKGQKVKKSPKDIYKCFKEGSIKVGDIRYTLIKDIEIQAKRKDDAIYFVDVDSSLSDLITSLEKANETNQAQLVIEAIEKVRNYNKLISDDGLQGTRHTWIWQNDKLEYIRNGDKSRGRKKIEKRFLKSNREIIIDFLSNVEEIPASVLTDIISYLNTIDGKAIVIEVEGCKDKHYEEYRKKFTKNKQSDCKTKKNGCKDPAYKEYSKYNLIDNPKKCKNLKSKKVKPGCRDHLFVEYDPDATVDDKSCQTLKLTKCTFDHKKYQCRNKVNSLNAPRKKLKDEKKGLLKLTPTEITEIKDNITNICKEIELWKGIIKDGSCICAGKKDKDIKKLNKSKCP